MRLVAALLMLTAACSPSPNVSTATPGAAASAPRVQGSPASGAPAPPVPGVYAVMVKDFLVEGGPDYSVSLVATDGHVAAAASALKRTTGVQIGNLSTSKTTLYYLDGDKDVRTLRPDGTVGLATHYDFGPHQVVAFAVSPDDRRIAVSVLDFTQYPVSTRLFVEDLIGGGNHVELFSSPTVLEWPAGWHNGALVMAMGINSPPQNSGEWFKRGHGYHVADAKTGNTIRSLCNGADSYIPESPSGTVCVQYPNASVVSWDGSSRSAPMDGACPMWGPLSPDGVIANRMSASPGGCAVPDGAFLLAPDGTNKNVDLPRQATPIGWIDSTHLVMQADVPPGSPQGFLPTELVVDITTGVAATIQPRGSGFFAAALPGGL
jgi:hypothetical protein